MSHAKGFVLFGLVTAGVVVLSSTATFANPNYGQAISRQKQGDWAGAIDAYLSAIEDLLATQPSSMLLPKSYVGCAYCGARLGDTDLTYRCLLGLWTSEAWANPNLPASPEFEGYRFLAEGKYLWVRGAKAQERRYHWTNPDA